MVTLVWGGGEGVLGEGSPPPLVFNYRGGENLVWENFCPEKFRRGKIPPQSLKVMGKIAPELAVRNFDTALTINWQLHVVGSLKCPEG